MTVRDELRAAAVAGFFDARDQLIAAGVPAGYDVRYRLIGAARNLVAAWQAAPLVEYAELLGQAVTAAPVLEAAIAEREASFRNEVAELVNSIVDELVDEVMQLRRELVLMSARVAVLEPLRPAIDPDEPELDDEPDLAVAGV